MKHSDVDVYYWNIQIYDVYYGTFRCRCRNVLMSYLLYCWCWFTLSPEHCCITVVPEHQRVYIHSLYIHILMHANINVFTFTHTHTHPHACKHRRVYIHAYTYTSSCMQTLTCVLSCIHIHILMHANINVCTFTHYTYTSSCMQTFTHTCRLLPTQLQRSLRLFNSGQKYQTAAQARRIYGPHSVQESCKV